MNKEAVWEYLKTIFITILITSFIIAGILGFIQYQVCENQERKPAKEDTIDYYLIGLLIDKNEYLKIQNPDNYKINMRLGTLYEIKKRYRDSELEFKNAIEKAPYGEYKPSYMLALLYVHLGYLDRAQATMDDLDEKPDKKLIKYKAIIYNKLGDKYYEKGDYEEAALKYQKSLSYYTVINSKEIKLVKSNLASSYVYLAEEKINEMEIDEAIHYLQLAKSIINAPIVRYKLALLSIKDNPELSEKYFDEVYKEAPELINYDAYYKFMLQLANEASLNGDYVLSKLYNYKAKKIKEYAEANVIDINDISLDYMDAEISSNNWLSKYVVKVEFRIKNVSDKNINSMYLEIVLKDGDKVINDYFEQFVNEKSILKAGKMTPLIVIKTATERKFNKQDTPREITAQIYVAKSPKADKLLLQEVKMQKESKPAPNNFKDKFFKLF